MSARSIPGLAQQQAKGRNRLHGLPEAHLVGEQSSGILEKKADAFPLIWP